MTCYQFKIKVQYIVIRLFQLYLNLQSVLVVIVEQSKMSFCSSDDSSSMNCCDIFNCTRKDLIKSGFYRTKTVDNLICCGCGWETGSSKLTIKHINFMHKLNNPDCPMSDHVSDNCLNYSKYKKITNNVEEMMRETFDSWPKANSIIASISDFVKSGFYYTGTEDAVACITCGIILNDWQKTDIPIVEHRRASPLCELTKYGF